jgi:predicted ATPase/DNA-binding SARP family transcriptional activator
LDDVPIEVKPRKALALLIYLAVTAERQSRDSLATLFWPNSSQRRARKNLRSRLSELNLTLGGDWIEADREIVGLRTGFWLDVAAFQQTLIEDISDPQTLVAAADLYRDDFLTGFTLPGCPEFDEWQYFQTESLRQALASALEKLVEILSEQGRHETAVSYARHLLSLDPLHEPVHRQLMQLYAHMGQKAAALRQYNLCRQVLEDELDAEPSPETRALYQKLQAGKVAGRKQRSRPRHNLPVQTTTFIGRETELGDVRRLLLEEPGCHLLNLVGPGGIGKTRLALTAARQTLDAFPDGTYFVSLVSIDEVDRLVSAVAEALRLTFDRSSSPEYRLLDYLSRKQLLLVLDNFEHLLEGTDLLATILSQAPTVTLMVTSRERLNLREEWVYEVQGLPFPDAEALEDGRWIDSLPSETISNPQSQISDTQHYSAVELFTQRVRQVDPHFTPSASDMAAIGRICQLVEGMPLGIELAAPWIRTLGCDEIAAEIEYNLDFLTTTLQNVPERHRSLRAVFEQTWQRLSPAEQTVLMKLSVFRGGCTREALEHVTSATLTLLSSLVDKALLRRTNTGRYEMHELLRQYTATELELAGQIQAARDAHCRYYVDFLHQREADVKGRRQVAALNEIEADFDNARAAWRWAASSKVYKYVDRALESLYWYCVMRNRYQEILELLHIGHERLAPATGESPHLIWGRVMARAPSPGRVFAEPLAEVKLRLETALAMAREHGDQALEAFCLWRLGVAVFNDKDDFSEPLGCCEQSLAIYQALGDRFHQAQLLDLTGLWYLRLNQSERGARLMQQGADLRRLMGDKVGLQISLRSLGWIAYHRGRFDEAVSCWQEAFQLAHEIRGHQESTYRHTGMAWLALFNRGDLVTVQSIAEEMQTRAIEINSQEWMRQAQILFGFLAGMAEDYATCRRFMRQVAYRRKYTYNIAWMMMGLCLAACGLGEMQAARQYLQQVLEMSLARKWTAVIAQCLPFAAVIAADAGEAVRAVELLALASHHPLSPKGWLQRWSLLTRLRAELETALSPTTFISSWEQGQAFELEATAEALLKEL